MARKAKSKKSPAKAPSKADKAAAKREKVAQAKADKAAAKREKVAQAKADKAAAKKLAKAKEKVAAKMSESDTGKKSGLKISASHDFSKKPETKSRSVEVKVGMGKRFL